MLTYAFQVLHQSQYEEVAIEEFEHIHDLFALILAKGISGQLKQGLYSPAGIRNLETSFFFCAVIYVKSRL